MKPNAPTPRPDSSPRPPISLPKPHWALCLWPGLPQIWLAADGSGWLLAAGFAALLNFSLVASFGWTEWIDAAVQWGLWALTATTWLGGIALGRRSSPATAGESAEGDLPFRQAQEKYLRGHHVEAELLLNRLLVTNPRDVDARLLRATIYRRTARRQEAAGELDRLECLEAARKWIAEIHAERRWLERDAEAAEKSAPPLAAAQAA